MLQTEGIHHMTAIVGHPQENIDFYAGVLGLRLVKKTINFDDPETYHLYFGNQSGDPGTIITFFPWNDAEKGAIGGGQVETTSYVVPKSSLSFWEKRLDQFQIPYQKEKRFEEYFLQFSDPHGLSIEIVERESGDLNDWKLSDIPKEYAIKGLGGENYYLHDPMKQRKY